MGLVRNGYAVGLCALLLLNAPFTAAEPLSLNDALQALPNCATGCMIESVSNSTCKLTDANCMCSNEALNIAITTCVTASCTVREQLVTKNTTHHLCGLPVDADHEIIPVIATFISITLVAVVLRIVARVLTKAYFWWDDYCNMVALVGCIVFTVSTIIKVEHGLGMDIWFVDPDNITTILKLFYVNMLLYTVTRFFVRASIILFYLRVFPKRSDNKLRLILVWTMVGNLVYNVAFFFAVVFQCTPIPHFWTQWEHLGDGKCANVNILAWVAAISGLLFDVWLLALPFPQLIALNVHWKKKVMGGLMFGVGASVMVISLVRLKSINEFTRAVNPTKDIVQVCIWSGIEINVGVICPCLPSFRLLLRRLWPRLVGSAATRKYEMYPRSGNFTNITAGGGGGGHRRASQKNNQNTNIIMTTEVGVDFELARPSNVSSTHNHAVESTASVTALVDSSDEDSLNSKKGRKS